MAESKPHTVSVTIVIPNVHIPQEGARLEQEQRYLADRMRTWWQTYYAQSGMPPAPMTVSVDIEKGASPRHRIQLTKEGFTIQHPVSCRPNLFVCPFTDAASEELDTPMPGVAPKIGVYYCSLAFDEKDEPTLVIEEEITG